MNPNTKDLSFDIGDQIGPYILTKYISTGTFGKIYQVTRDDCKSNTTITPSYQVIKIVKRNTRFALLKEYTIYKDWELYHQMNPKEEKIEASTFLIKLPRVYYYAENEDYSFMVMDELYKDLSHQSSLFHNNMQMVHEFGLSLRHTLNILHKIGYMHGDLKLENILLSLPTTSNPQEKKQPIVLYLIDFGLSNKIEQVKESNTSNYFAGNLLFSSKNQHEAYSIILPKDDMESSVYMMLYLYHQQLPWSHLVMNKTMDRKLINDIKEMKEQSALSWIKKTNSEWLSWLE